MLFDIAKSGNNIWINYRFLMSRVARPASKTNLTWNSISFETIERKRWAQQKAFESIYKPNEKRIYLFDDLVRCWEYNTLLWNSTWRNCWFDLWLWEKDENVKYVCVARGAILCYVHLHGQRTSPIPLCVCVCGCLVSIAHFGVGIFET